MFKILPESKLRISAVAEFLVEANRLAVPLNTVGCTTKLLSGKIFLSYSSAAAFKAIDVSTIESLYATSC